VYGPNVMRGYLGQEDKTRAVVRDGWYVTGDMARVDEDGFLVITGRLSRFAKVGGEMVPLQRIEEELHGILGTCDQVCAVTAVPDEKKGERVIVLHLGLEGVDVRVLSDQLGARGLPNLGLPGERDFYQIEEMPLLGSGKLDLKRLRELAPGAGLRQRVLRRSGPSTERVHHVPGPWLANSPRAVSGTAITHW
jgi:acyl-[acyl-carrier-protein]-phospholipid O-acyltransferase/long-chain-fatty-acid--[acyl-carrier-protein] ligase